LSNTRLDLAYRGLFAWQTDSTTQVFEYPWAHEQISARGKALTIVEIGGGLSGLQFVLVREGHDITNVDPGLTAKGKGWEVNPDNHQRLGKALRATFKLIPAPLEAAGVEEQSVDVALCISALEHFAPEEVCGLTSAIPRILKPSGVLILTVDLFLDLFPFCERASNRYGVNLSIKKFLDTSGLELEVGVRSELFGFEEFDAKNVLSNLSNLLLGTGYPCLCQCVVARVLRR
jgi:hypothetical protein